MSYTKPDFSHIIATGVLARINSSSEEMIKRRIHNLQLLMMAEACYKFIDQKKLTPPAFGYPHTFTILEDGYRHSAMIQRFMADSDPESMDSFTEYALRADKTLKEKLLVAEQEEGFFTRIVGTHFDAWNIETKCKYYPFDRSTFYMLRMKMDLPDIELATKNLINATFMKASLDDYFDLSSQLYRSGSISADGLFRPRPKGGLRLWYQGRHLRHLGQ